MTWRHLAFFHWRVPASALDATLPRSVELDLFDGHVWLGLTSFLMTGVRARLLPPLPRLSEFEELNLRTYVTVGGRPGVWFFSLDAASRAAVRVARGLFGLPYRDARMSHRADSTCVDFQSVRTDRRGRPAELDADYWPTGPAAAPEPGSLEHWLTERYCLYTVRRGRLLRLEIDHDPWPLQPGGARIRRNTVAEGLGLDLEAGQVLVHYCHELQVRAWWPKRVKGKGVRTLFRRGKGS
jgi:uncharacterized protein YqjF (DUF2071 family)